MTVQELTERLKQCNPEADVCEYEIDDVLCRKTEVKFVGNWAEKEEEE